MKGSQTKSDDQFEDKVCEKYKRVDGSVSDLSVLRKPMLTSVTGFNEAMLAFQNGTDELRQLMGEECDTIYECKVCRNIFRSLANFISHKRVYCRTKFSSNCHFQFPRNGFIDQDISNIIHEEERLNQKELQQPTSEAVVVQKDLSSIIERLLAKKESNATKKISDYYDQVQSKITKDELQQKKHLLQLDAIPDSNVAVYQTLNLDRGDEDTIEGDVMKAEVQEVHSLLTEKHTVIGPDGKALKTEKFQGLDGPNVCDKIAASELALIENCDEKRVKETNEELDKQFKCRICAAKFRTEKTLKVHIELRHITSTKVFQCPSCSRTFLQPSSVIKHLSNDHKKSVKKIRSMRDTILKRQMRVDEVQIRGPSRELNRLQMEKDRTTEAENNKAYLDNVENFNRASQSMCTYCNKIFERKAVLTSHLNSCRSKFQKMHSGSVPIGNGTTARRGPKPKEQTKENGKDITQDDNSSSTVLSFDDTPPDPGNREEVIIERIDTDNSNDAKIVSESNSSKRKRKQTLKILSESDSKLRKELIKARSDCGEASLNDAELDDENYWSLDEEVGVPKKSKKDTAPSIASNDSIEAKKIPFCEICTKSFLTKSNLKRHNVMFHYFKNRFQCKICKLGANKKLDIISHLAEEHEITADTHEVKEYIIAAQEKNENSSSEILDLDIGDDVSNQSKSLEAYEDSASNSSAVDGINSSHAASQNPSPSSSTSGSHSVPTPPKKRGRPRGSFKTVSLMQELAPPAVDRSSRGAKKEDLVPESDKKADKPERSESVKSSPVVPEPPPKRPVRNRVKPVDKDFVYDLSHLLKKEADYYYDPSITFGSSSSSTPTSNSASKVIKKRSSSVTDKDKVNGSPVVEAKKKLDLNKSGFKLKKSIQDAAFHMAQSEVLKSSAVLKDSLPSSSELLPAKIIRYRHSIDKALIPDPRHFHRRSSDDVLVKSSVTKAVLAKKIPSNNSYRFLGFDEEDGIKERILQAESDAIKQRSAALGIDYDALMMVDEKVQRKDEKVDTKVIPNGQSELLDEANVGKEDVKPDPMDEDVFGELEF